MARSGLYKDTAEDPLGSKLYITAYRTIRHAENILSSFGLTFHSFLILYYVDKLPRANVKVITELMYVSQPIVSRSLKLLEGKSLVARSTSSDRRMSEIVLTPEGRKLLKKSSGKLNEVSFIMRHQPHFRIAITDEQLERIARSVEIARERPLVSGMSDSPSESVHVRIKERLGV